MREAREEADRKRAEIEQRGRPPMGGMMGGGSGRSLGSDSYGMGEGVVLSEPSRSSSTSSAAGASPSGPTGSSAGRGMQLRTQDSSAKFMKSLGVADPSSATLSGAGAGRTSEQGSAAAVSGVGVRLAEQVEAVVRNDGSVAQLDVQGMLGLNVSKEDYERCSLQLSVRDGAAFAFKVHPYIDRQAFGNENRIALRDASKTFQTGVELPVLKWRLNAADEARLPLTVSCWPSTDMGGGSVVNLEYELRNPRFVLANVRIAIPIATGTPSVRDSDGSWDFDERNRRLVWSFDLIDRSCTTGGLEFALGARVDPASFFPMLVSFSSTQASFCEMDVEAVSLPNGAQVPYSVTRSLDIAGYQIVE